MPTFDIKEIVARAFFDYIGPNFPEWINKNKNKLELPDLKNIGVSILLGSKYFMRVKFSYKGQEFILPNEPLVSLSLTKTIVETATVGRLRKGTVKEYICTEDYQITIRGICVNEANLDIYPTEQVDALNKLFAIDDAIEIVSSPFFELYGIRKIVLKDISFEEMPGRQGLQKYQITAMSDQDFYAELKDQDFTKTNFLTS